VLRSAEAGEKLDHAFVRRLRRFEMDEMAGPFGDLDLRTREVFGKPVHPGAEDHRIVASAIEAARHLDLRQDGRTVAHQRHAGSMGRPIPGEAALEIAGLHEVVDEVLDLAIESARHMRPVPEHAVEKGAASLAALADELRCPGLLVEGLVPDLLDMVGVDPAPTDAGIRAVEEKEVCVPKIRFGVDAASERRKLAS